MDRDSVDELLTTTRAVRRRLDTTRPVEREVILECIQLAMQAPTGANMQSWRWMVVTDADKRAAIAEIYRRAGREYFGNVARGDRSRKAPSAQTQRVLRSGAALSDTLADIPVHVIPCLDQRVDHGTLVGAATAWASIMPAGWSFLLALRSRGLGSVWTTAHLGRADEVAELLGIPKTVTQAALFPVAYTIGDTFKPARRPPAETITSWNAWGQR
jgi:nitroreductase